ncbi:WYL domain-containing protein [Shewanella sp. 4_MG-2023]|uniref:WYL domain-containing protein n=1 Tax=Shewanella sp. 4_MG-2023 TaxID=3062652 RepID=UPI0026E28E75|nr:WYL domain-containing protein [Shewanella sp. 4_MG-2023]MDO6677092.1 WYL domain-containing protein [Shewanella sp. 4_MG-2023]
MNKLKLIDFLLMFTGKVQRQQLMDIANIAIATASRTLTEYRELYPSNIQYDIGKKSYLITDDFVPAFEHDAESALRTLAYGERIESTNLSVISPQTAPIIKPTTPIEIAAQLCRAIIAKRALEIEYIPSSGSKIKETVLPHAIFESKKKWYFRAQFCESKEFKTFKLSRVKSSDINNEHSVNCNANDDVQWTHQVCLTLGPHPKHPHPEALRLDLGLTDKHVVNINTSAALAGLLLAEWGVDSSQDACLDPYFFQFALLNRHELAEVESMKIAPGYIATSCRPIKNHD